MSQPHVQARLILLHKQRTSGRVRFFCLTSGVIAFAPLPALSAFRDEDYSPTVQIHPAAVIREAELHLGLPEGAIEAEAEFAAWVAIAVTRVLIVLDLPVRVMPKTAVLRETKSPMCT